MYTDGVLIKGRVKTEHRITLEETDGSWNVLGERQVLLY